MKVALKKPGSPKEVLGHFGAKGMRWGIRNERTSSEALKTKARKSLSAKVDPLIDTRLKQMFDLTPLTINDYKQMSTIPTTIPSGKTLYRLTRTPKDTSLFGHTYVTTNKRDATIYKGILPAQRSFDPIRSGDYKKHYEITLNTKKTLRGPSEKERLDILANLIDDKTAIPTKFTGSMSLRQYYRKSKVISRKEAKEDTNVQLALKLHRRVHQNMWSRKDPVSQSFMASVEKRGYDMLSDDNDSGIVSRNPVIILNPQKSTRLQKTSALTNDDILNAQINLRLPKQKGSK